MCGVLTDGGDDTRLNKVIYREGIAILDPPYHGRPATTTYAFAKVRFYWPK